MIYQRRTTNDIVISGKKGEDAVIKGIDVKAPGDSIKTFVYNESNGVYLCTLEGQYAVDLRLSIDSEVVDEGFQCFLFAIKSNNNFRYGLTTHFLYDTFLVAQNPNGNNGLSYSTVGCSFDIMMRKGEFLYFILFQNEIDEPITIKGGPLYSTELNITKLPVVQHPFNTSDYLHMPIIESIDLGQSIVSTGVGAQTIKEWVYEGTLMEYDNLTGLFTVVISGLYIFNAFFQIRAVSALTTMSMGFEINKNGSIFAEEYGFFKAYTGSNREDGKSFRGAVFLNVGDVVAVNMISNSSGVFAVGTDNAVVSSPPASNGDTVNYSRIGIIKY